MPDPAASLKPVLTPEGFELLNSLPDYTEAGAAEMNVGLRKQGHAAETVAAVLTQLRLRRDARSKFGDFASAMLFTPDGLQQSTRLPVAVGHAQRFREAGLQHVADLGCGLGADALAMASAGIQVTAVEADEATAAAATVNLMPFPEARVVHTTAEEFAADHHLLPPAGRGDSGPEDAAPTAADPAQSHRHTPAGWGLWLDPARRHTSGAEKPARIWDPEAFSPPLSFVTALAATGIPLGVKLGPGIPHELVPDDCEAQWVSIDGELVEVVLWFNALARQGVRRSATALAGSAADKQAVTAVELTSSAQFGEGPAPTPAGRQGLRGVLCEPDPAVIRAGLVADLAQGLGGRLLDEHIAYFCTDEPPQGRLAGLARGYRVLEVMSYSPKMLKRWCSDQQVTSLEIKKRGVDVVPETLRKQVLPKRTAGPKRHVTLVITRIADERVAAVVEPLPR